MIHFFECAWHSDCAAKRFLLSDKYYTHKRGLFHHFLLHCRYLRFFPKTLVLLLHFKILFAIHCCLCLHMTSGMKKFILCTHTHTHAHLFAIYSSLHCCCFSLICLYYSVCVSNFCYKDFFFDFISQQRSLLASIKDNISFTYTYVYVYTYIHK